MKRSEISNKEYPAYHGIYIEALPDIDFLEILNQSEDEVLTNFKNVEEENANFRYAEDKWSIKEILLHLIDVERVFVYRALRFSRKDYTEVPSFDHDKYVEESNAESRTLASIIEEFQLQRRSTLAFYRNLTDDALTNIDQLGGGRLSVRATAYFISGHELHHLGILKERYLSLI